MDDMLEMIIVLKKLYAQKMNISLANLPSTLICFEYIWSQNCSTLIHKVVIENTNSFTRGKSRNTKKNVFFIIFFSSNFNFVYILGA